MSHKFKLEFFRTINIQKAVGKKEVNVTIDNSFQQILANPQNLYSAGDVQEIIQNVKQDMYDVIDRTFASFSKSFLGQIEEGSKARRTEDTGDPHLSGFLKGLLTGMIISFVICFLVL